MPQNDYQKLARFSEEAMREAAAAVAAIEDETEEERQRLLAKGRAAIHAEQAERLAEGRKALGREASRAFSTNTLTLREKLLRRREEIVATLTDDVRRKLAAFAESGDYLPWLLSRCRAVTESYPLAFTIHLSERDMPLAETLRTELCAMLPTGAACTITADPSIHLGGARFSAEAQNLLINETLDERLAHSREAIIELLGPVSLGDISERNRS